MLDTKIWDSYAGEGAKYAIAAPPIEMYCTSYKESHPTSSISCFVSGGSKGYDWSNAVGLANDYNFIYGPTQSNQQLEPWLASPSVGYRVWDYGNGIPYIHRNEFIGTAFNAPSGGLRPVICLESGVCLKRESEGVYSIKR